MKKKRKSKGFRISSGLKNIIGKELITDDIIAIFELVKNAYDADAKNVTISFLGVKGSSSEDHRIVIADDGKGMSKEDVDDKWLFVGYSEKKEESGKPGEDFRDRVQKKRAFAGAKGIGRFSCDRLGKKLKLYTKRKEDAKIRVVDVDWQEFEKDQEDEFEDIKIKRSETSRIDIQGHGHGRFTSGTILEISSLNDAWNAEKLLRLKKYLQRLINPAQVDEKDEFRVFLEAKEFLKEDAENRDEGEFAVINGEVKNVVFEKLEIKSTQIECEIDKEGKKIFTKIVDKGNFIFSIKEDNPYPALKDVKVKLFFLNKEAKSAFTRTMGLNPVEYGSIFLYKNGFRIHPYGDPGDDWLRLEITKGQGYKRHLSGRDIIGRVEIIGNQHEFKEVSSRDGGIIKNDSHKDLLSFIDSKAVNRLEKYVIEGLGWDSEKTEIARGHREAQSLDVINKIIGQVKGEKEVDVNPNIVDILKKKEVEKIPQVIKNIEAVVKYVNNPAARKRAETQLKSMRSATRLLQSQKREKEQQAATLSKQLRRKEKEILFYRDATPGALDEKNVHHTIGISTFRINEVLTYLMKNASTIKPDELKKELEQIRLENEKIRAMANIVTRASFNMQVSAIKKDVVSYISQYISNIASFIDKDVKIKIEGEETEKVMTFKPLELSIVVDNFISNAKKAGATKILFKFSKEKGKLFLCVMDNGRGVRESDKESIFNLGFTTTRGSGIGLYHVKQMISKMGGKIRLVGNKKEENYPGACFEVVVDA